MKVRLMFEFTDLDRQSVAHSNFRTGKVTGRQMREFCRRTVFQRLTMLHEAYQSDPEVRRMAARKLNKLGPGLHMKPATTVVALSAPWPKDDPRYAADAVARKQG
jgi:CubicO group peptidase (beta-lactamase class C family)